jgi:hypothetical protein
MSLQYEGTTLTRKTFAPGVFSSLIRLAIASVVAIVWQGIFGPAAMAVTALTSSYQWQFVGPKPPAPPANRYFLSLVFSAASTSSPAWFQDFDERKNRSASILNFSSLRQPSFQDDDKKAPFLSS